MDIITEINASSRLLRHTLRFIFIASALLFFVFTLLFSASSARSDVKKTATPLSYALYGASREYVNITRTLELKEESAYCALPHITEGSSGSGVLLIQCGLYELGYLSCAPTGLYGGETARAAAAFKADCGLKPDGVFSGGAYRALAERTERQL